MNLKFKNRNETIDKCMCDISAIMQWERHMEEIQCKIALKFNILFETALVFVAINEYCINSVEMQLTRFWTNIEIKKKENMFES